MRGDTGITEGEERCEIDEVRSGDVTVVGVGCASVLASCETDPPKKVVVGVGDGVPTASALDPARGGCTLNFCDVAGTGWAGSGRVRLGLGLGKFIKGTLALPRVGLGLRLLNRELRPLRGASSEVAGATIAIT